MRGRFGRGFGGPWSRDDWEGWTPPWMQQEGGEPRFFGPGGPRRPRFFGPRGPWGFRGPGGPWGFGGPGGGPWEQGRGWHGPSPEQQALRSTAGEVARLFMIASRSSVDNPARQAQLRDFLERSRKELSDLIYSSSPGEQNTGTSGSSNVEQA
jgi:hypothetical protein